MMHVISLGAGVQSSTMALMFARGELTPMPDCAIFADTGAEPSHVYTWLRNGVRGTTQRLYLHRSLKPLAEIDFRSAEDAGQRTLFGDECEGMCGV